MKRRSLNYRFHNPNPEAKAAGYLLEILMEANEKKVQAAIRAAAAEEIDGGYGEEEFFEEEESFKEEPGDSMEMTL